MDAQLDDHFLDNISLNLTVINGHCHNIQHEYGENKSQIVFDGQPIHKEFLDDVLESFNDILIQARPNSPQVIT